MKQPFKLIYPEEKKVRKIKPYVTFPITNSCTLKCRYCGDGGEMALSETNQFCTKDLFEWHTEARKLGVEKFRITGGEPFLHEDFEAIVHKLSKDANQVLINSNGTLLEKNYFLWRDTPMNCLYVVNFHGYKRETFESITNVKGSYDRVRKGIELLAQEGRLHRLNIVICKKNYQELDDVIRFCRDLGCDLKIQDVVSVPWQFDKWETIYYDTKGIENDFEKHATFIKDHRYASGFGTPTKIYTVNGVNITFKSIRNGSHYDMDDLCKDCEYYPCHEGIYDLFVFPDNTAFACNWTEKSKAPGGSKKEQLEWLIQAFQRGVYKEASSNMKEMIMKA